MFTLSSVSCSLWFWSVTHTSIYENSEPKIFKNIKFWGKISNNWSNDFLGTSEHKTTESCWKLLLAISQCYFSSF